MGFDWTKAQAFLATAEHGSLSAAGRVLGLSQPTVGRQVTALEEELDVVLFERVGNSLELTPTGADLVEHVRAMNEAAERVDRVAAGQSVSLEGLVRLSAGELHAATLLPPILVALRKKYPAIEIELLATNDASDLARREADIALRNFRPSEEQLVARKVGDRRAHLYASSDYLIQLGCPNSPEQLTRAQFIGFDRSETLLSALQKMGLPLTMQNFALSTGSQLVQWELARQGAGIAILSEEVGDTDPLLQRVLPTLPPFVAPLWLTTHRELSMSRRLRLVFDFLYEELACLHSGAMSEK